jgi:dihydrofolate reductase
MKKIILNLATSLDGFIEGPNGETDWCIMDDDMHFDAFLESIDTIFYGRISFDAWGNYQPGENADESEKLIWSAIHSKKKLVFSHQNREDDNAVFISKNIAEEVAKIKEQDDKDIWLYGGANLIKTFIELNLIDVFKLSVHPIALGTGKPLFENLKRRMALKLISSKVFRSGVVELTYQRNAG